MRMAFRWFGTDDPVTLARIRQIPGMAGIVSAVSDVPPGEVWPRARIRALRETIEAQGLELAVIESVPVHEDIKRGLPSREALVANWCTTLAHLGAEGVRTVCWNFMPVFDWVRTTLDLRLADGSTCLAFDTADIARRDPARLALPGWDASYAPGALQGLVEAYRGLSEDALRANLAWFLERVVPAARAAGIRLALHPDDPPRALFGIPRIAKNGEDLRRILAMADEPAHGLTLCSGSLGADPRNDVPALAREFSRAGRVHFAHLRNVAVAADGSFHETAHLSSAGSLDMAAIVKAHVDTGFEGWFRPDHGRMIWDETGRPGYGLYDRALGAVYLNGLVEGIRAAHPHPLDAAG